jgi:hypothetical protein
VYSFDENSLAAELMTLPEQARVAFAAATATRQLSSYERLARALDLGSARRPRELAVQLWSDVYAVAVDHAAWSARLDEVMALLPEESEDWAIGHALADDALSSLAYAIRCLLKPDPQEAVWAGRRAYEAADQAAICVLGVQPGSPTDEAAIKSHNYVQRELARQRRDLSLLHADSVDEMQRQAFSDELLTEQEADSVV